MKSLVALIKREYLEHRGAFLIAPGVILALLAIIMAGGLASHRFEPAHAVGLPSALKVFEFAFFAMSALWGMYLLVTLFFYYADAFSADRRNNAMLFWKSMPVSDFKVLSSKMLAGMTVLPALIFGALLLTGVLIYITTVIAAVTVHVPMPGFFGFLSSAGQIALFILVALALGLLWYAPFFAWVGLLSALFRRWSIPLAFLIPGIAGLAENLILSDPNAPHGGYVLSYLRQRFHFGPDETEMTPAVFSDTPFDAVAMISRLVAGIDWAQLVGGLIVAALLVYAASEYRRRTLAT